MTICVNGCPKTGNHALLKAVELLGLTGKVDHAPYGTPLPEDTTKVVFIYRDPRNMILSRMRYERLEMTTGMIMARAGEWMNLYKSFEGYLTDISNFVCSYEDLISDPEVGKRLATFLEVPYREECFTKLPGRTMTWFANHSDFRTMWNTELAEFWAKNGYDEIGRAFGYEPYILPEK